MEAPWIWPEWNCSHIGLGYAGTIPALHIAKWNGNSWQALGNGINKPATSMSVGPDGALYVAGPFSIVDGQSFSGIVRWNGAWTSFQNGLNGTTSLLLWLDTATLVAAGSFYHSADSMESFKSLAIWSNHQWSLMEDVGGSINDLDIDSSGGLIVTGYLHHPDVTTMEATIMRWKNGIWTSLPFDFSEAYAYATTRSGDGSLWTIADSGWNSSWNLYHWNDTIWQLVIHITADYMSPNTVSLTARNNGDLVIGGYFSNLDTSLVDHLAHWNGSQWNAFGSGIGRAIHTMAIDSSGRLALAGRSSTIDRIEPRSQLFVQTPGGFRSYSRLPKEDQWRYPTYHPFTISEIEFMDTGMLAIAGSFWDSTMHNDHGLVFLDVDTWNTEDTPVSDWPYDLCVDDDGTLYAGGMLGINIWDGFQWSEIDSSTVHTITHLMAKTGTGIYAAGFSPALGGDSLYDIKSWDGIVWNSLGLSYVYWVSSMIDDGNGGLFLGGDVVLPDGTPAQVAHWDGVHWNALAQVESGGVQALALDSNGNLYAGGFFSSIGGITAANIAQWDGIQWHAMGSGVQGSVASLLAARDTLWVGGYFAYAGGQFSPFLAKVDISGNGPVFTHRNSVDAPSSTTPKPPTRFDLMGRRLPKAQSVHP